MIVTPNSVSPDPEEDVLWYKRAVIYEVHPRAFHDSNGDGAGDFPGLTAKLEYLRDLGVSAIWLLPFYPSPLKDDGYDIADYFNVHPMYGTVADFKACLQKAHDLGLRMITELVLNHTSDQHPWFQRARRAPPGSNWRNYYVWNDNSEKYKGTRVIFKDTEASNWAWGPLARAYYWHRFYSHQPDLNFDHPPVHEELFKVLEFWLDLGVDGVRLDAIPYLYEREGTSCENLPETHLFLKQLRKRVDEKYSNRMLLAEANQWPDEAAAYFGGGKGDECHMAFHFPLMPRLFMSLRLEDQTPIVDILQQTPPIPETAQWALFLRNHDELTLEMVTDEERDYMYRMYAHDYQARLNLGIRRRLAPLLGNDRKRIELLNALLFSLPGTPVIYYGDEIGMGENIYLGDRNGVRTPMQWSSDKNAGFSKANPQSLYLPINLDPENHYEAVNVEVQERNPHSLLKWFRHLVALRKRWKAFGLGTLEFLNHDNRRVLAFTRQFENECILVVANLSRFVQPVKLDLSVFKSRAPIELFGRSEFPVISDERYFLTLGGHAFYWFSLEKKETEGEGLSSQGGKGSITLKVEESWEEIFKARNELQFEKAMREWLPSRRWFGGKARVIKGISVHELTLITTHSPASTTKTSPLAQLSENNSYLAFINVEYVESEPDTYVLPLAAAFGKEGETLLHERPELFVAHLQTRNRTEKGILYDATGNKEVCRVLFEIISEARHQPGLHGEMTGSISLDFKANQSDLMSLEVNLGKAEQSNSSVVYGDQYILKLFRRLDAGINPDLEIGRFLSARKFPYTPPLVGSLDYRSQENGISTIGVLQTFVPGCMDAWDYTLDTLNRFYERILSLPKEEQSLKPPRSSLVKLAGEALPKQAVETIGSYLESARSLGERTAALHRALAEETEDPNFAPEPFTPHFQRGLYQSMRNLTVQNFKLLSQRMKSLPEDALGEAQQLLDSQASIISRLRRVYESSINAVRIRHHGDYHLGQLLYTGKEFLIIDFEGEPAIALSERRLKRSALRDVAGMVRSFHYAALAALSKQIARASVSPAQLPMMEAGAAFWASWVSALFFKAYRQAAGTGMFIPQSNKELEILTDAFLIRKTVYELGYELNNRPSWVGIPIRGLLELLRQEVAA